MYKRKSQPNKETTIEPRTIAIELLRNERWKQRGYVRYSRRQ
jgi:hypothetical protein